MVTHYEGDGDDIPGGGFWPRKSEDTPDINRAEKRFKTWNINEIYGGTKDPKPSKYPYEDVDSMRVQGPPDNDAMRVIPSPNDPTLGTREAPVFSYPLSPSEQAFQKAISESDFMKTWLEQLRGTMELQQEAAALQQAAIPQEFIPEIRIRGEKKSLLDLPQTDFNLHDAYIVGSDIYVCADIKDGVATWIPVGATPEEMHDLADVANLFGSVVEQSMLESMKLGKLPGEQIKTSQALEVFELISSRVAEAFRAKYGIQKKPEVRPAVGYISERSNPMIDKVLHDWVRGVTEDAPAAPEVKDGSSDAHLSMMERLFDRFGKKK